MNVVVTGGTGFIGRKLIGVLRSRGDTVIALARDPKRARATIGLGVECIQWDATQATGEWEACVARADAVVNLAGEPALGRRWNDEVKEAIKSSRVLGTRHLVAAMSKGPTRPRVLVNASGMDFYGETESEADESAPAGQGFLADVCQAWEAEAQGAAASGIREVRLRIGLVLGDDGGALERMALPFKLFAGGPVGNGRQWISWVHVDDVIGVTLVAIDDAKLSGPVNLVSPRPERMEDFARELGRAMHRPSWAPVPLFALRIVMGEAAKTLVESKRVVPRALEKAGYVFRYTELPEAMRAALGG